MIEPTIYDYIKSEANKFLTEEIEVGKNWRWNFYNHVQLIFHLKNGVFFTGDNNWLRAFQNIMEPILNLSYWTEDIEVKDVFFYIEETTGKVLSFLLKKYHDEVFTREHDLDDLFDKITESDLDYGGVLVQKGVEMPEVIPLQSVAFCDQTDILGGPVAFKHYFSPDKLRGMSKFGWGEESNGATITLDELCILASAEKEQTLGTSNKTTGKTIEVYIVRGNLPEQYLEDNDNMEDYYNQLQIVAFYTKEDSTKEGVALYRKKEDEGDLKFFTSMEVYQRALGRGVGESILHQQIWTNCLTIWKMNLMEASSRVPLYTDDSSYTTKNKIQDMDNLEITTIEDGKKIYQVPTTSPTNITLYSNEINSLYNVAQTIGSAQDPIMGAQPVSGTTFRGQERNVAQAKGLHDRRKGQRAKFIEKIYRWDIIPRMTKEILKGKKFLATLSTEELTWISDNVSTNMANEKIKALILSGKEVTKEEQDTMTQLFKQDFLKKGNKHLVEILKKDFEDVEIKLGISVANKQKNIADLSDKVLSIFQTAFSNPVAFQQTLQIPGMSDAFSKILEYGGMSPIDFQTLISAPPPMQPIPSPIQQSQLQAPANQTMQ